MTLDPIHQQKAEADTGSYVLSSAGVPDPPGRETAPSSRGVEAEDAARDLVSSGRIDEAVTLLLRAYSADLFGFLIAILKGDEGAAGDAFSELSERAWRNLKGFEWRCSARAWLYVLARNAALRQIGRKAARNRRETVLGAELASMVEAQLRTATRTWQKTETRSKVAELRDELDPDDRALLVLRIDRKLSWEDLARVFLGDDEVRDGDLKRESARLRKRYQLVKERLIARARALGLVPGDV